MNFNPDKFTAVVINKNKFEYTSFGFLIVNDTATIA